MAPGAVGQGCDLGTVEQPLSCEEGKASLAVPCQDLNSVQLLVPPPLLFTKTPAAFSALLGHRSLVPWARCRTLMGESRPALEPACEDGQPPRCPLPLALQPSPLPALPAGGSQTPPKAPQQNQAQP